LFINRIIVLTIIHLKIFVKPPLAKTEKLKMILNLIAFEGFLGHSEGIDEVLFFVERSLVLIYILKDERTINPG